MVKNKQKGFTLIELLVVVLLIGILVAIALPKYETAVAKSKFSTLKLETQSLAQAINRYRTMNGKEPTSFNDLDVYFSLTEEKNEGINIVGSLTNGETCFIINSLTPKQAGCFLANQKMRYYYDTEKIRPYSCISLSDYKGGLKVCQQDAQTPFYSTASCGVDFGNGHTVTPCYQYFYY